MEKAKVYFTDFRTKLDVSQGKKLQNLCKKAGIGSIDFDGKLRSSCISANWEISRIYGRITSKPLRTW